MSEATVNSLLVWCVLGMMTTLSVAIDAIQTMYGLTAGTTLTIIGKHAL